MPQPTLPYKPRKSQFPDPQTFSSQGPATPPSQSSRPTAFADEQMPELPSEEDHAKMSARFDEAMAEMAEIDWLSDPFLGIGVDLSDILSFESSPALGENFELDFIYPARGKNTVSNPRQAQQIRNEAEHNPPGLLVQQGRKRKEHDEGDEDFQRVQLDETEVRRSVKRMRSLPSSNIPSNQGGSNPCVASSSRQHRQHLTPRDEENQSPYSKEQSFGGPTPRRAQPLSQASVEQTFLPTGDNPYQERNKFSAEQPRGSYSDRQPPIGSPFIPTVTTGVQTPDINPWKFLGIEPADTRSHRNPQAGQMLEYPSMVVPSGNASQSPISRPTAPRPRSRIDRGGLTGTDFDESLQDGQIMRRTSGTFPSRSAMQPSVSQPAAMSSRSRLDRGGPAEASFHNNLHAGDILSPTSAIYSSGPTSQPPMSQIPMTRPTPREHRGHMRENQGNRERRYGYDPYAESQ